MGCVSVTILLLLISVLVPFVGPLFGLLTPLPFMHYTTKLGLHQGLKIAAITLLIVAAIAGVAGTLQIMFFCLEFTILGVVISEIYRRKLSFGLTIFLGTIFMLFMGSVFLFLIGYIKEMGPMDLISNYFQINFHGAIKSYEGLGLDQEKVLQLEEFSKALMNIIAKVYPSLMIISTACIVWLNVVISKPFFRMGRLEYPAFGPLDRWHSPELMVWGLIAAGFASFLFRDGLQWASINALIVISVIYAFHGISIVLFFLNKYNVPAWIRISVYFLILFQQIFLFGLAIVGLFDQWIDIRKIHRTKEC
jgi:uncharacterized protein YybS (DUF2232 family)